MLSKENYRGIELIENPDYEALKKDFKKETSKLDNWLNHRRIDEYFKEKKKEK